ncbi:MAG TPA: O-acetyl-ADP-ribose deacetylase [Candidatus Eisenbacteria bacterium]|nr:O-acetyl-ADP-ribose deacetylase [Candidatus Eisenbacteria bacterium]
MTNAPQPLRVVLTPERSLVITGPADITREPVDAIVNAANSSLMGGGGVDGAIHRAGGPAILEACKQVVARQGRLPAGKAVATPGGHLPAKYVIHTVGPVWSGGKSNEAALLASCHTESIRVADELQLRTIAFPAISTGIYGYPVELASHVAIASAAEALQRAVHVREVKFVLFDAGTLQHFCDAARSYTESKSLRTDS